MQPGPISNTSDGRLQRVRPTRVVILAQIRFYREGLALYFGARDGFEVVGSAEDVAEASELARTLRWDVALVDIAANRAGEAIRAMRTAAPGGGIVAIGVRENEEEIISLAELGVFGFVARDASLDDLARAVTSAARNEAQCSNRVAAILVRRLAVLTDQVLTERTDVPLTRRQLEIVQLIDEGLPNKAIAQRLFIEVPTVKNHVHNILERLGVHYREEAASEVRRLSGGLLPR